MKPNNRSRRIFGALFLLIVLGIIGAGTLAFAATKYYAACESGHYWWESASAASYSQADSYARAHDEKVHGGSRTAAVLSRDE